MRNASHVRNASHLRNASHVKDTRRRLRQELRLRQDPRRLLQRQDQNCEQVSSHVHYSLIEQTNWIVNFGSQVFELKLSVAVSKL